MERDEDVWDFEGGKGGKSERGKMKGLKWAKGRRG
jgi:hypothetical protein